MTENLSVERNTSNQRKLERIGEKSFDAYDKANDFRVGVVEKVKPAKTKIFARYDGTYDVVWYQKIKTAEEKQAVIAEVKAEKKAKKKAQ